MFLGRPPVGAASFFTADDIQEILPAKAGKAKSDISRMASQPAFLLRFVTGYLLFRRQGIGHPAGLPGNQPFAAYDIAGYEFGYNAGSPFLKPPPTLNMVIIQGRV